MFRKDEKRGFTMEIIFGILAMFLQFNFFTLLFFAGIFYAIYYDLFTSLIGMAPTLSLIPSRFLPTLRTGLDGFHDGFHVFGVYLFFILFALLIIYHLITYWYFWSVIGVILLVTLAFQIISGMGGFGPFLKFVLSILGILIGLAVAFVFVMALGLILWDKYEDRKFKKQQQQFN